MPLRTVIPSEAAATRLDGSSGEGLSLRIASACRVMDAELVQVAAVAAAEIEAIDRAAAASARNAR